MADDHMNPEDEMILKASVELIGRTGAQGFELRYSDDKKPIVWMALAYYDAGPGKFWQVGASFDPPRAAFKLCEALIDGGTCTHCKRPTGVTLDIDSMPGEMVMCWYQLDPELKTFRRGCEGDDQATPDTD